MYTQSQVIAIVAAQNSQIFSALRAANISIPEFESIYPHLCVNHEDNDEEDEYEVDLWGISRISKVFVNNLCLNN